MELTPIKSDLHGLNFSIVYDNTHTLTEALNLLS